MIADDAARTLLEAPLRVERSVERLGRALWLYVWLAVHANARGVVCRTAAGVARELDVGEAEIEAWLTRLADAQLIEILAPAPHLVVKLTMWSGGSASADETTSPNGGSIDAPRRVVPVVRSVRSVITHASSKSPGVGGRGEGGDPELLAEIRAVIGDDPGLDGLFARFPEPLVRRALARTRSTPPDQIKRSRAALFFYLLAKLNRHSPHA